MSNTQSYEEVLRDVLVNGVKREDRTGEGTISVFSRLIRYDLQESFPLITSKFVPMRLISGELRWFLRGSTNVKELQNDNNHIWDEWRAPYENDRRRIITTVKEFSEIYRFKENDFIRDYEVYHNNPMSQPDIQEVIDNALSSKTNTKEWNLWKSIITGGDIVSPGWYSFDNFKEDLPKIPHYDYWVNKPEDFTLTNSFFINNHMISGWHPSTVAFVRKDGYDYPYIEGSDVARRELIPNGYMGEIYGAQWRNWNDRLDQIKSVVDQLKDDPYSRRMIVSAWNADQIGNMALPPCHVMFQLYVAEGKLSLQIYQRSADMFLGVPFNIASYALLTHIIAKHVGLDVGELTWIGGDCHIYLNHIDQVKQQLSNHENDPRELPQIKVSVGTNSISDIENFKEEIIGYNPHERIKGEVAV